MGGRNAPIRKAGAQLAFSLRKVKKAARYWPMMLPMEPSRDSARVPIIRKVSMGTKTRFTALWSFRAKRRRAWQWRAAFTFSAPPMAARISAAAASYFLLIARTGPFFSQKFSFWRKWKFSCTCYGKLEIPLSRALVPLCFAWRAYPAKSCFTLFRMSRDRLLSARRHWKTADTPAPCPFQPCP